MARFAPRRWTSAIRILPDGDAGELARESQVALVLFKPRTDQGHEARKRGNKAEQKGFIQMVYP